MKQPIDLARQFLLMGDELNPYAVFLRYDLAETQSLDRQKAK